MQPNKFIGRGPQNPTGQPEPAPSFSQPVPPPPPPPIAQSVANAAQAVSSAASAVSSAAQTTAASAQQAALRFGPDGRIRGLDGVLDQIFESLGKQVTPLVTEKALPILQRDRELQKTVGAAAGRAAAQELKPYIALLGLGVAGIAVVMAYNAYKKHKR